MMILFVAKVIKIFLLDAHLLKKEHFDIRYNTSAVLLSSIHDLSARYLAFFCANIRKLAGIGKKSDH